MKEQPKAANTTGDKPQLRIGYVPIHGTLDPPGDRRRFVFYARKRNIPFEVVRPEVEYDAIVLSEAADITYWSCYSGRTRLIYDLVDAYLHIPIWSLRGLLRGPGKFLAGETQKLSFSWWGAVRKMCRRADAVLVTTKEQKRSVETLCPNVHMILDSSEDYNVIKKDYQANEPFRLIWEGLPHNVAFFKTIAKVMQRLDRRYPLELNLVTKPVYHEVLGRFFKRETATMAKRHFPRVKIHEWKAKTCAEIMTACDLGVIPIPLNDRFAAGKPENKLHFLWKMGIPAVVSAIPSYQRTMEACGADLACSIDEEWESRLERLITDEAARKAAGDQGRAFVEKEYSDEKLLEKWDAVFASLEGAP